MRRTIKFLFPLAALCLLAAEPAHATNGMNMIGYSIRSSGMGGADVAVDSDCSGAACNPATLGGLQDDSMALGMSLLMPQLSFSQEAAGADVDGRDQYFPLPYLAYARKPDPSSPWTLGVDLFAQGGMGVDVRDYPTPGGPGSFDSLVRYGRLTMAANYSLNDRLSLGAGVMVGYADIEFSLFPEYPGGIAVDDLSSFGYAGRVGLHYRFSDTLSFGFQYTSEAALDMEDGTLTANYGPGGTVTFDAEMEDFTWPREAEAGFAYHPLPRLLIAGDIKWIDWSDAIDTVKVRTRGGPAGVPAPVSPGSDALVFAMNWQDQWVFALGLEYIINERHTIRAGYNYGKSPVPDDSLSPLFPAIVEHHLTLGYRFSAGNWGVDLAFEHAFANSQTNHTADPAKNPFGPGITVEHDQNTLHCSISYFF
ncbi:MAG: TonB-dependent receptor [Desulfobulbaceae bacterium]